MKKENISVDEALKRGQRTINLATLAILFGGLILMLIFTASMENKGLAVGIGFPVIAIACLAYRSISASRWRIWAFTNVRNVHELEHRAIKMNLISKRGGWAEKLEFRSAQQKEQWRHLLKKFDAQDEFHDDAAIPSETVVYFSKKQKIFQMVLGVVFVVAGVVLAIKTPNYAGYVTCAVGIFIGGKALRDYMNKAPRLILSDNGLKMGKNDFVGWENVSGEDVVMKRRGKHMQQFVVYSAFGKYHEMQVFELDKKASELEAMLRVYRGRHRAKIAQKDNENGTYRF